MILAGLGRAGSPSPLRRWLASYVSGFASGSAAPAEPSSAAMAAALEQVFPSPLPFPDAARSPPVALGGPRRKRFLEHRRAERWANRIFGLFSFWEAGGPRTAEGVRKALAPLQQAPSKLQLDLANNVKGEVLPFCRLGGTLPEPGRGSLAFQQWVERLSTSGYHLTDPTLPLVGARPVKPGRISLPQKGAP